MCSFCCSYLLIQFDSTIKSVKQMIGFNQSVTRFILVLLVSLALMFGIHLGYLLFVADSYDLNHLILAYIVNFVMGVGITFGLYKLKEKYAHSLGFIFMGGSMLKFVIFFLAIYPFYMEDGEMSSLEFGYFFIPYAITLVFETLFISQILNETEY